MTWIEIKRLELSFIPNGMFCCCCLLYYVDDASSLPTLNHYILRPRVEAMLSPAVAVTGS